MQSDPAFFYPMRDDPRSQVLLGYVGLPEFKTETFAALAGWAAH